MFGKTRKLSMRFHCQKEKSLEKERYNCGGIESCENDCQKKKLQSFDGNMSTVGRSGRGQRAEVEYQ